MRKVEKTNIKEKTKKILRKIVFAMGSTAIICLVAFCIHAVSSGIVQHKIEDLESFCWNSLQNIGFDLPVRNSVLVAERKRTEKDDVKKIINDAALPVNYQILRLDLEQIKQDLKKLPWVKQVEIKRQLPNMLYIILKEREPIALFKNKDHYYPVDEDGTLVYAKEEGNVEELIIVVGKGSVSQTPKLVNALNEFPKIKERIMGAKLIGERRWQLYIDDFENGIVVDLPDTPLRESLKRLTEENDKNQILDKQVKRIDLRLNDRVVVEPLTADSILRPFPSKKGNVR